MLNLFVAIFFSSNFNPWIELMVHYFKHIDSIQSFMDLFHHFNILFALAFRPELHKLNRIESLGDIEVDIGNDQILQILGQFGTRINRKTEGNVLIIEQISTHCHCSDQFCRGCICRVENVLVIEFEKCLKESSQTISLVDRFVLNIEHFICDKRVLPNELRQVFVLFLLFEKIVLCDTLVDQTFEKVLYFVILL